MKDKPKSRGQQLAEEQWVQDLAKKVVVRKETQDLNDLMIQHNMLGDTLPELERKLLEDQIATEAERLNPDHKWDHEEVYVSNLEQKKKK